MAKVKVLIEGYDKKSPGCAWHAAPTVILVQERGLNIIVDPGNKRELLLTKLKKENLEPEDIDYVLVTHWHVDHFLLAGIFPKAKILDNELIYIGDTAKKHKGVIPGTKFKIISTPGHDSSNCSLLVLTRGGLVAIVGDLFWWSAGQKQKLDKNALLNLKDKYVKDKEALFISRRKILEMADWIIPGHGKMFKNPKRPLKERMQKF